MKHGVLGLLKHISQSSAHSPLIQTSLENAEVVRHIAESGIWDEKVDAVAEVVQLSAIGVVKHLCNASGEQIILLLKTT